jgi:hypothetical protein
VFAQRREDDKPRPGPASWSVILHDVGSAPMNKIGKMVNESCRNGGSGDKSLSTSLRRCALASATRQPKGFVWNLNEVAQSSIVREDE